VPFYRRHIIIKSKHRASISKLISLFNNNYRYLDDILTVNADLPTSEKQAYLQEITFNKTNTTRDSCQYVDLDISVQYTTNLAVPYDSRSEITVTTECKQTKHRHIAYF
jgi:hypothetical protein